eukprot:CAMPEP_0170511436 /NCGR_PEP_ID=MMETSP0208-20121228/66305_1 /TAXON_ID=197538 /ORGANISM="Strombidium inclinatum, Strain S3" /LENGTH=73 /DNA_ID=CAMNT_0010794979 /DNA_START=1801 /DNA_END=2022 /DNA_ORIENTATION=+
MIERKKEIRGHEDEDFGAKKFDPSKGMSSAKDTAKSKGNNLDAEGNPVATLPLKTEKKEDTSFYITKEEFLSI